MSQQYDPDAIGSLNTMNPNYPEDSYLQNLDIIDEAMQRLGKKKVDVNAFPNYYDDLLKQLIDLVPLE